MGFLDEPPVRGLHRLEIGIAVELQRIERAHLVAASAAVAGARPFPVRRLAKAGSSPLLIGGALGRLLRA